MKKLNCILKEVQSHPAPNKMKFSAFGIQSKNHQAGKETEKYDL